LSGVAERLMIIRMTTPARPQQRYDHRLRDLVQRTGDATQQSGDQRDRAEELCENRDKG
jgi:hypothetical protein